MLELIEKLLSFMTAIISLVTAILMVINTKK